jgi:hypothetical protein
MRQANPTFVACSIVGGRHSLCAQQQKGAASAAALGHWVHWPVGNGEMCAYQQ